MLWPLSPRGRRPQSRRAPRRRPSLRRAMIERMEERTLLSTFLVTSIDDNGRVDALGSV
jgi:hypothetical protein